jgi:hypothetical protein
MDSHTVVESAEARKRKSDKPLDSRLRGSNEQPGNA